MIASDIHGSLYYCDLMLKRFNEENADKLILLGDILNQQNGEDLPKDYNPEKVAEELNKVKDKIIAVKGSCDTDSEQKSLDFSVNEEYTVIKTEKRDLYATHGHLYNKETPPPLKRGDVLLCGNTHVPLFIEGGEDFIFINPGSVSVPLENSHHGYVIYEDNKFFWKDIETAGMKGQCTLQ